ncbi:MAG TPA: pitrilysin family protein, partial [Tepidisphaeraceae bacterium]
RATRQLSRQALADALDKTNTTLGASGNVGVATFNLRTKRANLPAALDLLRQVLREPALPAEELDILKRQVVSGLEENRTQPTALVDNFIARKLRPYPQDDVRYEPTLEESIERCRAVTLEQVKALYEQYLGAARGELVIIGDFDEPAVTTAMSQMLADWSARQPYERIQVSAKPLQSDDQSINTPDRANAQYGAALAYAISDTDADYPALVMVNRILGGSGTSRLWTRVRETEGLSYGVRSAFAASALDPYADLTISAIVNPANMPKLKTTMQEELAKLTDKGVSPDELKRAQVAWLDQQTVARSQDAGLAVTLARDLYAGRTIRHEAELEEKIRGLTADQVTAAAKKYLDPSHLVIVTAGDFGAKAK